MRRKKAWKRGLLGVAAVLAVYLFAQKYIIEGVVAGAVKG